MEFRILNEIWSQARNGPFGIVESNQTTYLELLKTLA